MTNYNKKALIRNVLTLVLEYKRIKNKKSKHFKRVKDLEGYSGHHWREFNLIHQFNSSVLCIATTTRESTEKLIIDSNSEIVKIRNKKFLLPR